MHSAGCDSFLADRMQQASHNPLPVHASLVRMLTGRSPRSASETRGAIRLGRRRAAPAILAPAFCSNDPKEPTACDDGCTALPDISVCFTAIKSLMRRNTYFSTNHKVHLGEAGNA